MLASLLQNQSKKKKHKKKKNQNILELFATKNYISEVSVVISSSLVHRSYLAEY